MKTNTSLTLFDPVLVVPAIKASFTKLSPRAQWRNPVMFVVYIGSILTTLIGIQALQGNGEAPAGFILSVAVWLWFTVLFANFAEALAEGRSKAQAASLRSLKKSTWAKKLQEPVHGSTWLPEQAENLRKGDVVLVDAGDMIPVDGEVIQGVATVDESAAAGLQRDLTALSTDSLHVVVQRGIASADAEPRKTVELDLVGSDRPGIVQAVSRALAELGVNVESLETALEGAPMSGELLFKAAATLHLPGDLPIRSVRTAIEAVAADLMVDITLKDD